MALGSLDSISRQFTERVGEKKEAKAKTSKSKAKSSKKAVSEEPAEDAVSEE